MVRGKEMEKEGVSGRERSWTARTPTVVMVDRAWAAEVANANMLSSR